MQNKYRTLWYDFDEDLLVESEYILDQRYRNKDSRIRKTTVVGEKEAYTIVTYFSLKEGVLPPLEGDIGVKVIKHVKNLEV